MNEIKELTSIKQQIQTIQAPRVVKGPTAGVFRIGERVNMKGHTFEIRSMSSRGMKLKLLKGPNL